mgnify:CR=1 FL=1
MRRRAVRVNYHLSGRHKKRAHPGSSQCVSSPIKLNTLLGQTAGLQISLSDGTRTTFTGLINHVAALGSDGGLARYRVKLVPWLWCLTQTSASRVWQDKTVLEIVESVFARHAPYAAWALSDEVMPFLEETRPRR